MAKMPKGSGSKKDLGGEGMRYGGELDMDALIKEYSRTGKPPVYTDESRENTMVSHREHWELDYDALRLDVVCWLSENEMTNADLDHALGFENLITALCTKKSHYKSGEQDLLLGNFMLLCTALDLYPQNYFMTVNTTRENQPQAKGRGKKS